MRILWELFIYRKPAEQVEYQWLSCYVLLVDEPLLPALTVLYYA